jgi:hypothetical protein
MRFPYRSLRTRRPVYSLAGAQARYRPLIPVELAGPLGSRAFDCSIDSGTDDTLFPKPLAAILGVAMTSPPDVGEAQPVGGQPQRYSYGQVKLRVSDGTEAYEWEAVVGFIDSPLVWPLLGHAGFLQFFDVQLLGAQRETVLTPNSSYPGRVFHRS